MRAIFFTVINAINTPSSHRETLGPRVARGQTYQIVKWRLGGRSSLAREYCFTSLAAQSWKYCNRMKTEVVTTSSSYQMLYRVRYNAHYHRQYTLNNIGSSKRTTTDTTEGLLLKNLYCLECTTHSVHLNTEEHCIYAKIR